MQRTRLERKTPLRASKTTATYERPAPPPMDLEAAARALTRQAESAAAPRREHQPVADPTPPAPKPKDTGFPYVVRETILDRDKLQCQMCGRNIDSDGWPGYSLQHRDNRGSGGTTDPRVNWPSNGITLCGSGTTGCHGWVESHPTDAERLGFAVPSWADPETVPVHTHAGWKKLDHRGSAYLTKAPVLGDALNVAQRKRAR